MRLDGLRRRLDQRREGETASDAMRAWVEGIIADVDWKDERDLVRRKLVSETPSLRELERANLAVEARSAQRSARPALPPSSLRPRLIAAAVAVGALGALGFYDEEQSLDDVETPLVMDGLEERASDEVGVLPRPTQHASSSVAGGRRAVARRGPSPRL